MNKSISIILFSLLMIPSVLSAQEKSKVKVNSGGLSIEKESKNKRSVSFHFLSLDLGINMLHDRTNYNGTAAQDFLQMDPSRKNAELFSLRQFKSINVNIWPFLVNFKLLNNSHQKFSIYSGAGMQIYNFKFSKSLSYVSDRQTSIIYEEDMRFDNNKLAFAYASIPLMLNFKTKLAKGAWLVYGFGVIGGVSFDAWTKQQSHERGTQKQDGDFNFNKFNLNLSGEIGIDNYIRFFATYQVTPIHKYGLDQYPLSIGIRFFGI